ncbi:uncharacterized protein [Haliotis cracherodii]|uniref:uncharacterized protein n=1 Tax=Haliotis cracherodii TaxID=6455 RepID=UPI0039EAB0BE
MLRLLKNHPFLALATLLGGLCCYLVLVEDVFLLERPLYKLNTTFISDIHSAPVFESGYIAKTGGDSLVNRVKQSITNYILPETPTAPDCLEANICKDSANKTDIYFYKRTDFDELVEKPFDVNASISHAVPVVPRIVHFCLFSNGTTIFRFHYMIAILAASRIAKPEKIYFWHDNLPVGEYWKETRQKVKNLYLVHRDRPTKIRGNDVRVIEHVADIVRLEALLEYGGMYFDTDSIVVNPIDPLLVHDVTMGHAVPRVLANGIMFSKPWSDFQKVWHHEYKTFKDKEWGSHSVVKPYQLSQKYPNLIHIEPASLCRPNWRELAYLFGGKKWNWQKNNFVVHLYMRFGPKGKRERNRENIKMWNTTAGSIMRYIYYGDAQLINDKDKKS